MSAFHDVRVDLAGKLAAAGVDTVTLDPRQPPPCVLVDAPTVRGGAGVGGWTCDYPVVVLAVPPGGADTLTWLLDQVELILRTLGPAAATPGRYDPAGKDLPAYTVTYPRDVPNPDC